MVSLQARNTAQSVQNILESQDIMAIVTVAGSTAGGVIIAQRLANRVLPMIGLSPQPSTLTDALGSAGFKGLAAVAVGLAAAELSGLPQVVAAFIAAGHLTSAGVDLVQVFLSVPELNQLRQTRTRTRSRGRVSARQSGKVTSGSAGTKKVRASAGGVSANGSGFGTRQPASSF